MADIFDLKNKFSNNNGGVRRIYTEEEKRAQLKDYIVVPKEYWDFIPVGTHVRWEGVDGNYRRGGFIKFKWLRNSKKFFQIETIPNGTKKIPNYVMFPVAFENIKILYKKINSNERIEFNLIKNDLKYKSELIHKLVKDVEELKNN